MANANENLSELQREAETSRADLIHTVDSLQSRVRPSALKDDIKEYVRDTGKSLFYDIERRVRDNPLQSAAIAAGLAFPLWRLVSNIPAPIALIGAGIVLTQRSASSHSGAFSSSPKRTNGASVSDAISHAADDIGHQMSSAADIAKQKINTLKTQTADAVDNAVHSAQDFASDSATAVSDAVSHVYESGVQIAEKATHDVELALDRTKDRLIQAIEQHPLVVGGIGLLIGAFVASCIPTTSAEASAFGEMSDGLKNHALNAMSDGMGVMKAAAGEVFDNAVAQTTERGLTSNVVEDVIQKAGEKVQSAGHEAINRMGAKTH